MAEQITVKLVKSLIGSTKPQLATARALGLRKVGDVVVQPDNAATKGKIRVLAHLLQTHPTESAVFETNREFVGTPDTEGSAEA